MTVLQRTDLTTSQKIQCAAAAVSGQHAHGSKTALSEAYEISRPTVYAVGAAAESVLRSHFETPLLQGAAVDVRVDDAQLRRAVVALRVLAPNAIRPIEDLAPLLYPGVKVSYGTIQQMLVEAEGRAARFNAQVSLGGVEAGALDEMFSQGEPVLAGVDLDSGYLFGLSLSPTRDGKAWAELLREGQAQGLGLSVVVKDAARGIAAGVSEVFPHAEQRDDCFHVLYEMNKVRRRLERRAYGAIEREGEALGRLGKIRACDKARRRKAKHALRRARRECAEAIERFDAFEAAMDTLRGALECVDIATGELHRPEHVQALIEGVAQRIESLGVGECAKLAKYLRNRAPGLVLAQKRGIMSKSHIALDVDEVWRGAAEAATTGGSDILRARGHSCEAVTEAIYLGLGDLLSRIEAGETPDFLVDTEHPAPGATCYVRLTFLPDKLREALTVAANERLGLG